MARSVAGERAAEWRERLERFARSGLTIAKFCEREGVSAPSFYQWRRRLGLVDHARRSGGGRRRATLVFQQVIVDPPARRAIDIRLACGALVRVPAGRPEKGNGTVSPASCAGRVGLRPFPLEGRRPALDAERT